VTLNGGDAAILEALVEIARRVWPDAELTIFDSQPSIAARYHDHDYRRLFHHALPRVGRSLHERRLLAAAAMLGRGHRLPARAITTSEEWRSLEICERADLVISTGGTYLVEAYDLTPRLFDLALYERLGKRVVFFAQSLGPFRDPVNRRALRRAFARSPLALLRDERSRGHLLELGVDPAKLHVVADAVFAIADEAAIRRAGRRPLPAGGPGRIAISVREWKRFEKVGPEEGMARYEAAVAALATRLAREGAEVVFLSTCQGIPEYWTDDSALAARIHALLEPEASERVRVDRDFHSPRALTETLAGFDLVVATRMHMAILALVAGTPVLPIAYEFKTQELFERLGCLRWVLAMEETTPETLETRYDEVVQALHDPSVVAALFDRVAAERARALLAADLLKALPA
jgi:colanic acid/amylovoran biosynthesis protein